jgi:hypothetical protein
MPLNYGAGFKITTAFSGCGVKQRMKIKMVSHPKTMREVLKGSSISDGGCWMPTNLPKIKINNNQPG